MNNLEDINLEELAEQEFLIEDQDLRLLKAIVTDSEAARELASNYDHTLFVGDAKLFAEKAIKYYKLYHELPTKRVMLDEAKGSDSESLFDFIWDKIDTQTYSDSEFKYDLDKVKDRHSRYKLNSIKNSIEDSYYNPDYESTLKIIKSSLDEIHRVRHGTEKVYVQKTLKDFMPEFREDFIRKSKDPSIGRGILTGYSYLDFITNGLQPSDLLVVAAETGGGKALPLNTPILTPSGFKLMGDIHPGDVIFGMDGNECQVVAEGHIIYASGWKFIFNDNTEIISHENHEWLTFNRLEQVQLSKRTDKFRLKQREKRADVHKPWLIGKNIKQAPQGAIRSTAEIVETLFVHKNKRRNHAIPNTSPIKFPEKALLIDPYILGIWLGDGTSTNSGITSMDDEIIESVKNKYFLRRIQPKIFPNGNKSKASTYFFDNLRSDLKTLGLLNNKHIPNNYLFSSIEQRLALLQGLMDSDGFVSKKGNGEFNNTNKDLINGFAFLVNSLGEKCFIRKDNKYSENHKQSWTVAFSLKMPVCKLSRKLYRHNLAPNRLNKMRYIKAIEKTEIMPMKCIQVSSPDHMYLAGEQLIPTHNSLFLNNIAVQMWMQKNNILTNPSEFERGYNVQYFSLEMPFEQCFRRTMSRLTGINNYALRDCKVVDGNQLDTLAKAGIFAMKYPAQFEIVDIPRGVTPEQIEERFLEAVHRGHRPDIVVIDYIGLMEDPTAPGDDWLKLGQIAGKLHEFARAYNVVVLTAVQLNRPKGKEPEDIIGLHRIGRSGLIMTHASLGIQLEKRINEERFPDMPYHIIKNRNGEMGHHFLKKQFHCSTLLDGEQFEPDYNDLGSFSSVMPDMDDISEKLANFGWK